MYGTVARMRALPGVGRRFEEIVAEYEALAVPGHLGTYVYRLDSGAEDYYLVVVFEDRESYVANANDPAQHQRYLRMRELLAEDPRWHDGEIAWAHVVPPPA